MSSRRTNPKVLGLLLALSPFGGCRDDDAAVDLGSESGESSTTAEASSGDESTGAASDTSMDPASSDGPMAECGNGEIEAGEVCDDADLNGEIDRCNSACNGQTPYCGDGNVDVYEACDDGGKGGDCNHKCQWSGILLDSLHSEGPGEVFRDAVLKGNRIYHVSSLPSSMWRMDFSLDNGGTFVESEVDYLDYDPSRVLVTLDGVLVGGTLSTNEIAYHHYGEKLETIWDVQVPVLEGWPIDSLNIDSLVLDGGRVVAVFDIVMEFYDERAYAISSFEAQTGAGMSPWALSAWGEPTSHLGGGSLTSSGLLVVGRSAGEGKLVFHDELDGSVYWEDSSPLFGDIFASCQDTAFPQRVTVVGRAAGESFWAPPRIAYLSPGAPAVSAALEDTFEYEEIGAGAAVDCIYDEWGDLLVLIQGYEDGSLHLIKFREPFGEDVGVIWDRNIEVADTSSPRLLQSEDAIFVAATENVVALSH